LGAASLRPSATPFAKTPLFGTKCVAESVLVVNFLCPFITVPTKSVTDQVDSTTVLAFSVTDLI
jgi:hypothetical protein